MDDSSHHLLPLDMGEPTEDQISKWLRRRTIPNNRAFVRTFLAKCGISANRPMSIISVSKAMGIQAIPYGLSKWKGILCSTCSLVSTMILLRQLPLL